MKDKIFEKLEKVDCRTVWSSIALFYAILFVIAAWLIFPANFWFAEDSVKARLIHSNVPVSSVDDSERNWFDYSKVYLTLEDGTKKVYELDSNIAFMYEFK